MVYKSFGGSSGRTETIILDVHSGAHSSCIKLISQRISSLHTLQINMHFPEKTVIFPEKTMNNCLPSDHNSGGGTYPGEDNLLR